MSMPQVYMTEVCQARRSGIITATSLRAFSSKWKAIAHFNREYDHPGFEWLEDVCNVSVDGTTVGWITKKIVQ